MVESLLKEYPNVLTLRVRMPIVADLVYPRNFITKIIKYDKVRGAWLAAATAMQFVGVQVHATAICWRVGCLCARRCAVDV